MSAELDKIKKVLNHSCDFVCTDEKYIRLVPMLHFLNMDGQELALYTMKCNSFNCPVCNSFTDQSWGI